MSTDVDIEELREQKICCDCVGEDFLGDQISNTGKNATCSYCAEKEKCISVEELSERIETAFDQHYYRTSDQPTPLQYSMLSDRESNYEWYREGQEVVMAIMDAASIPEKAASDIQKILEEKYDDFDSAAMGEETEFSPDSHYEESGVDGGRWWADWEEFQRSLKTESRFFNRSASSLLEEVFNGIDSMRTQGGRALIVDAGPDTEFTEVYRARSFQLNERLVESLGRPDMHLGSPPSTEARAGRMNADGISVFYGSNNPETALAEIRPPVGCQVAVARFSFIQQIRLLDLTALSNVTTTGSIFDPTYIDLLEQTMFLRNLSSLITIPVMPDHETLEYLATQAIADFLATENAPLLDGILFPSVQTPDEGLNFVLFHKAARVETIELPPGTRVDVDLGQIYEEGWEREYSVSEAVPPQKDEPKKGGFLDFDDEDFSLQSDLRPPTLKIDLGSVHIHLVKSVNYETKKYPVTRHRWETGNTDF
ncbi:MAG: RES family NAD+ phosphorylase [Proteobacteria bacterium]|nr:RES family NAD+ phosphorylase [Pseudomonadota bacterium]MBU1709456.1 RES family NAD+ phosphorylase [Pseudomonadota bacterium]